MVSETQQRLLDDFEGLFAAEPAGDTTASIGGSTLSLSAGGGGDGSAQPLSDASGIGQLARSLMGTAAEGEAASALRQLAGGTAASPASAAATPAGTNTRGGPIATASDNGGATSATSVVESFLESGMGIVPLITGLVNLFSGGGDTQPVLQKYAMPSALSFASADTAGGLTASDFDQTGAPRTYGSDTDGGTAPGSAGGAVSNGSDSGAGGTTPQITVNVQAMDAQSFMDYSSQIAQAVRGAMLNLSSLNDVVNEL